MILKIKRKGLGENLFFVYFFSLAFLQILEVYVNFSITKIIFLIFALGMIIQDLYVLENEKLLHILLFEVICIFYFIVYKIFPMNSGFAFAALKCIMFFPFLKFLNFEKIKNWDIIETLLIIYLIINIYLYYFGGPDFFGYDVIYRYKGGSSDPNLLATLICVIILMEFWGKSKKAIVVKILCIIVQLLISSRSFIAISAVVILISIIACADNRTKMLKRILVLISIGLLISMCVIKILIKYTNLLHRFTVLGGNSNGRSYLFESFVKTLKHCNVTDWFFGVSAGNYYRQLASKTLGHSYAENSFMTLILLFGVFGVFIMLYYLFYMWKLNGMLWYRIVFCVTLLNFFFQDTVCYVQGFISIFGALVIVATDSRKEKVINKNKKLNFNL